MFVARLAFAPLALSRPRFNAAFNKACSALTKQALDNLKIEQKNYVSSPVVKEFTKKNIWTIDDRADSTELKLSRSVDGFHVNIEFSYTTPQFENNVDVDLDTDFVLTVTNESTQQGVRMYCCTTPRSETASFAIGNVKYFSTPAERDSLTAYPGPDFEDLPTPLMTALDQWLESLGVDAEVCEVVSALSVDKEQREYIKWLETVGKFFKPTPKAE